jgi:hypothetical protein
VTTNNEESSLHPADTALFVAASLRGYWLEARGTSYALSKRNADGTVEVVADALSFKEVARRFGATGVTTLRQTAERAGLKWPDSPEAFLAAVKKR